MHTMANIEPNAHIMGLEDSKECSAPYRWPNVKDGAVSGAPLRNRTSRKSSNSLA
jgi:hypothetical protein